MKCWKKKIKETFLFTDRNINDKNSFKTLMECIFASFMITCTCIKHLIVMALKFPNGFKCSQNDYTCTQ